MKTNHTNWLTYKHNPLDMPHQTVVHIQELNEKKEKTGFEIIAKLDGVSFKGESLPINNEIMLDSFAWALSGAWKHHLQLKKSLQEKLMAN